MVCGLNIIITVGSHNENIRVTTFKLEKLKSSNTSYEILNTEDFNNNYNINSIALACFIFLLSTLMTSAN